MLGTPRSLWHFSGDCDLSLSVSLGDSIPDRNALGQELRLSAWGALAWSLRRRPPVPCPSPPCAALNYTCVSPKQSANDHKESRDWLAVVLTCSILLRVFLTPDKLTESCTLTPFLKKRQAAASAFPTKSVCGSGWIECFCLQQR